MNKLGVEQDGELVASGVRVVLALGELDDVAGSVVHVDGVAAGQELVEAWHEAGPLLQEQRPGGCARRTA